MFQNKPESLPSLTAWHSSQKRILILFCLSCLPDTLLPYHVLPQKLNTQNWVETFSLHFSNKMCSLWDCMCIQSWISFYTVLENVFHALIYTVHHCVYVSLGIHVLDRHAMTCHLSKHKGCHAFRKRYGQGLKLSATSCLSSMHERMAILDTGSDKFIVQGVHCSDLLCNMHIVP